MIRNRFDELCTHLKTQAESLHVRPEQFDSELEDLIGEPGGHKETVDGFWFANFRYRGVLYLDRLDKAAFPLLVLLVKAWLDENDDVRDDFKLPAPKFQAIDLGGSQMDVVMQVEIIDPVYLAQQDGGPVKWRGKNWAVAKYDVNVAEGGIVNAARI